MNGFPEQRNDASLQSVIEQRLARQAIRIQDGVIEYVFTQA